MDKLKHLCENNEKFNVKFLKEFWSVFIPIYSTKDVQDNSKLDKIKMLENVVANDKNLVDEL